MNEIIKGMANAAEAIQENFEEQGEKITAVEQNIEFKKVTQTKNGDGINPHLAFDFPIPDGYSPEFPLVQNSSTGTLFVYNIAYYSQTNSLRVNLCSRDGNPITSAATTTITVGFRKGITVV